jgi:hypothetical protein
MYDEPGLSVFGGTAMNTELEVGFANDKGGCGKTTGAAHLLWWAEENAVPAVGVTVDPQGNLIQRLLDDPRLQPDRRFRYGKYIELVFSPHHTPELHTQGQRLVVWDYPPGLNRTYDSQLNFRGSQPSKPRCCTTHI